MAIQPVRVTSLFGRRFHPIFKRYREHQGLDLAAVTGQDVFAAQGGTVIAAGPAGGHGNQVQLQHAGGLVTRYSHLSRILVRVGDALSRGERLGLAGRTGDATGPHLHFELWRGNGPVGSARSAGAARRERRRQLNLRCALRQRERDGSRVRRGLKRDTVGSGSRSLEHAWTPR